MTNEHEKTILIASENLIKAQVHLIDQYKKEVEAKDEVIRLQNETIMSYEHLVQQLRDNAHLKTNGKVYKVKHISMVEGCHAVNHFDERAIAELEPEFVGKNISVYIVE